LPAPPALTGRGGGGRRCGREPAAADARARRGGAAVPAAAVPGRYQLAREGGVPTGFMTPLDSSTV